MAWQRTICDFDSYCGEPWAGTVAPLQGAHSRKVDRHCCARRDRRSVGRRVCIGSISAVAVTPVIGPWSHGTEGRRRECLLRVEGQRWPCDRAVTLAIYRLTISRQLPPHPKAKLSFWSPCLRPNQQQSLRSPALPPRHRLLPH